MLLSVLLTVTGMKNPYSFASVKQDVDKVQAYIRFQEQIMLLWLVAATATATATERRR
jgi:hypothetical protein